MLEAIIGIVLGIGVFCVAMVILAKKENKTANELISCLTEEQKAKLEDNQVENYDPVKCTWTQRAMIGKVNEKNNKVVLSVIWYNSVIQDPSMNRCTNSDVSVKKDVFEAHHLKEGDFVKIFIDLEKIKVELVFEDNI